VVAHLGKLKAATDGNAESTGEPHHDSKSTFTSRSSRQLAAIAFGLDLFKEGPCSRECQHSCTLAPAGAALKGGLIFLLSFWLVAQVAAPDR
jgi:hypothetical protein